MAKTTSFKGLATKKPLGIKSKKKLTKFRPMVRSRHPSHEPLREKLPFLPFRSVIRLGSTTERYDDVTHGGARIECNTAEACGNSASKFKMKAAFIAAGVKTAPYLLLNSTTISCDKNRVMDSGVEVPFPVVAKLNFGSRGTGMRLIKSQEEFKAFQDTIGTHIKDYLIEEYFNYVREYRLHVSENGCFLAFRKVLREETPAEKRWYRNDDNCNWILEDNPLFDKPTNWNDIVAECVKALKAVKLDICGCDVRVQSKDKKVPEFFIVETNSACSLKEKGLEKYINEIPKVLTAKYRLWKDGKGTGSR